MTGPVTRRDFVRSSIGLAAGVALAPPRSFPEASAAEPAQAPLIPEAEWRNKQPMRYRRLGRTGFMISEIVGGGDPISPTNNRHVEMAIEEAHRRDFGVIAMKTAQAVFHPDRSPEPIPERSALLDRTVPGELNLHQKAYRLALLNPHLSAAISNMMDEKQMRENLAVVRTT